MSEVTVRNIETSAAASFFEASDEDGKAQARRDAIAGVARTLAGRVKAGEHVHRAQPEQHGVEHAELRCDRRVVLVAPVRTIIAGTLGRMQTQTPNDHRAAHCMKSPRSGSGIASRYSSHLAAQSPRSEASDERARYSCWLREIVIIVMIIISLVQQSSRAEQSRGEWLDYSARSLQATCSMAGAPPRPNRCDSPVGVDVACAVLVCRRQRIGQQPRPTRAGTTRTDAEASLGMRRLAGWLAGLTYSRNGALTCAA